MNVDLNIKRDQDDCGPLHESCDCEDECPKCGGFVEDYDIWCECEADDCDSHDMPDDGFRCVNCHAQFHYAESLVPVRGTLAAIEQQKLKQWTAWAKGEAS